MKVSSHETVEYEILLTRAEAEWLKAYMQNPRAEVEDSITYHNRQELFNALKSQGV